MTVAKDERRALCDLFDQVGPDAPTLCGDWTTRDLAAHLVVRERRLDAAGGIAVKALAGYTKRVQDGYAARSWSELVGLVREGPTLLSPFRIGFVDDMVNTVEYFVHHEDVRRAGAEWSPRPADARRDSALWTALGRTASLMFRKSPVGVLLRTPDGTERTARSGPDRVVVTGAPGELLLFAFGRDRSEVELAGGDAAVAALRATSRGM